MHGPNGFYWSCTKLLIVRIIEIAPGSVLLGAFGSNCIGPQLLAWVFDSHWQPLTPGIHHQTFHLKLLRNLACLSPLFQRPQMCSHTSKPPSSAPNRAPTPNRSWSVKKHTVRSGTWWPSTPWVVKPPWCGLREASQMYGSGYQAVPSSAFLGLRKYAWKCMILMMFLPYFPYVYPMVFPCFSWFFHVYPIFFVVFLLLFVKFRMIFLPETEAVTSGSSPAVCASEIYQPKIGIWWVYSILFGIL